jgi:hypothetical protein
VLAGQVPDYAAGTVRELEWLMALDGLRSAVRRIADTLTATPAITPAWPDAGSSGAAAAQSPGSPPAYADGNEVRPSGQDPFFPCPTCARPLGRGTGRCSGCGTRLVLDVPMSRASVLAGAGLVVGLLVGGLGMALLLPRNAAAPDASTVAGGPAATGATLLGVTVSSSAGAALRGTTELNGRLAAEAQPLAGAVRAKSFPTADVVRILRRMRNDVRAGSGMVPALGGWPEAGGQQAALSAFYAELTGEIDLALAASVTSRGTYKAAAKKVLTTLSRVPGLDADARVLADAAGMKMPVVTIPDVLR